MTAEEIYQKAKEVEFHLDELKFMDCNAGAWGDVVSSDHRSDYYKWLPKLIKLTQPKQIVELGGAMGVAALCMIQAMDKDQHLYSITLAENGLEFSFIKDPPKNLHLIVGDDLDLKSWPTELDLGATDLWFIDSEHTYEQVRKEIDLYKPYFKEGSIILFDDIHINDGLAKVWEEICDEIPGTKFESDLHHSGYGIVVVGAAWAPDDDENPVERDPHLVVYGSSYDRGLEHLLKMWPDIKQAVPDARLRVFYGWNLFDVGHADNPSSMAWKDNMNKLMEQDGITHLGRISHGAVRKEFERAGIWAYPTHFGEISCITAMKAQAYGSVPVVIDYAALKETVQFGIKVKGDIYDQETKDLYKNALIALLNDEEHQQEVRKEMIPWATEHFAWSQVAKQWDEEFRSPKVISLDEQVDALMDHNQALKAWDLVKDTDYSKKDLLYKKVRHAFEPEEYTKYYSQALTEHPVSEETALDCTTLAPRFKWVVEQIEKQHPTEVLDLGCADGYLCLTLAKRGFRCYGVNMYKPSIDYAQNLARKHNLEVGFEVNDLLGVTDQQGKYEVVVLLEVLEHVAEPQKILDHCMGLVKKGGSFYLSTPSPEHIGIKEHLAEVDRKKWDEDDSPAGHLRIFNETELRELLKNYKIEQFLLDEDGCWNVEVKHND